MQEHSWNMQDDQAQCDNCDRVVLVVPINTEGDWNSGTVFCPPEK